MTASLATSTTLSILDKSIRIFDGLFSLNDLHKAAGGENKHTPFRFMRNEQTQALIQEINQTPDMVLAHKTLRGGTAPGTYVCRELVYAYAMWISARFHLLVIRAFDSMYKGDVQPPAIPTTASLELRDEIHRIAGGVRSIRCQILQKLYRRYRVNSYLKIPAEHYHNALEYVRNLEGDYIPKAEPSPALALPDGQHYVVAKDGVVLYHKVLSKTVGKDSMPAVEAGGLALNNIEAQQLGVALHCAVRITNVWRSHISPMLHAVKSPIPSELGDNVSSLNFVANMLSSSLYSDGYPLSHGGKALATR
jgi:hypothetical protein